MTSILDTIDNAITDYETSTDAMRWTPEPPATPPAPPVLLPAITITPEQAEAMRARLAAAFEPVRAHLARIGEALKQSWDGMQPMLSEAQRLEQARAARVSRIRGDYRAKRGRRW
ncbi:hypothetical protein ABZ793_12140 [Micromonospora sp. NPDC047465]|uniref:hypothetical protein n=1 Tax=Micromonospora sp. NPDC047465 TaxID=3154813 RepID=UPI0033C23270